MTEQNLAPDTDDSDDTFGHLNRTGPEEATSNTSNTDETESPAVRQ
jgi:hypothetical protein